MNRRSVTGERELVCAWRECGKRFAWKRGQSRPPMYCSEACRRARHNEETRNRRRDREGRPDKCHACGRPYEPRSAA